MTARKDPPTPVTRAHHSQDPTSSHPDPGALEAPRPAPPRRPAAPGAIVPEHSRIEQIQDMALEDRAAALVSLREDLSAALHQAQDGAGAGGGQTTSGPRG